MILNFNFFFFFFLSVTKITVTLSEYSQKNQNIQCIINYLNFNLFQGLIEFPYTLEYNESIKIDNKRVINYPSLILSPLNENDISLSIKSSKLCNFKYSILSGGHSAAGYCINDGGITVNLARYLKNVKFLNNGIMSVQAGALWSDIYKVASTTSYLPIGGGCPTVAAGGFLLGGGWSFLSRSYGLGCDNIVSLRVALANGEIVTANSTHNSDLLWASKGGGGGNFGVVTSYEIQAHLPRSELMYIGEICYPPFEQPLIHNLWTWWFDIYPTLPDWMDITPVWLLMNIETHPTLKDLPHFKDTTSSRMFCFTVICNGNTDSECSPIIKPLLETYPPALNSLATTPFIDWQLANIDVTDAQDGFLYLTSGILQPNKLTVEHIDTLTEILKNSPSERNLILFHIGGGAIAKPSNTDTAFPHRSLQLMIQIKGIWEDPSQEEVNTKWVKDTRHYLDDVLSGSYINYIDSELSNWKYQYYNVNYPKLLQIKKKYDKNNFFQFKQSIGQGDF